MDKKALNVISFSLAGVLLVLLIVVGAVLSNFFAELGKLEGEGQLNAFASVLITLMSYTFFMPLSIGFTVIGGLSMLYCFVTLLLRFVRGGGKKDNMVSQQRFIFVIAVIIISLLGVLQKGGISVWGYLLIGFTLVFIAISKIYMPSFAAETKKGDGEVFYDREDSAYNPLDNGPE